MLGNLENKTFENLPPVNLPPLCLGYENDLAQAFKKGAQSKLLL